MDYFGCGYLSNYNKRDITEFIVTKLDNWIYNSWKISFKGSKYLSVLRFKEAVFILKNKKSLNTDNNSLERLLELKIKNNKTKL